MSAVNNNYVSGFRGFGLNNYLQAAAVAPFQAGGGDIVASVFFYVEAIYQDSSLGAAVNRQVLWANMNDNTPSGWELSIIRGSDDGLGGNATDAWLAAKVGNGATTVVAAIPLSGANQGQYVERLIHATLFWDASESDLWLAVNGNLVARNTGAVGYAPSDLPATLGARPQPGAVVDDPATATIIVGAGFYNGPGALGTGLIPAVGPGQFAGLVYRSACDSLRQAFFSQQTSTDWKNRYEAIAVADSGVVQKQAGGANVLAPPSVPAVVPDVGSAGVFNTAAVNGLGVNTPLNLTGVLALEQLKNPQWYHGATGWFANNPG